MTRRITPPKLSKLLGSVSDLSTQPLAVILAGHNGSGKTSLWTHLLSDKLQIPLINADRLTESILPPRDAENRLPTWAARLRDTNETWQYLSQQGVKAFRTVVMENQQPFAFETVFSHWQPRPDGTVDSKADIILEMQERGYFVVLIFVGLQNVDMSILRVETRRSKGGHAVPLQKLKQRFPRTQQAIGHAAPLADLTLMFDNSRSGANAFTLARVQRKSTVLFDCRDPHYVDDELRRIAGNWLDEVTGPWSSPMGDWKKAKRSRRPK